MKRIEYFHSSKPQPQQFTILVRNIPSSDGRTTVSDAVDSFFRENHPSTYLSHVVIHRTSKLRSVVVSPQNKHSIYLLATSVLCYNLMLLAG